jgi:hypothetical protein
MIRRSRALSAAFLLCLSAGAASANQRLPEWTYDDISQVLSFLDSTGSVVQLGTVNPSTHAIALAVGGGGVFTVPNGGTGVTSFTANNPLIGAGASAIAQGTRSGNTTTFATSSGALTSTHCVSIDASGNFVDAGGTCTTGGSSGIVSAGTTSQLAYYASSGSTVSGLATAASSILTTGAGSIPVWAGTLPCANTPASTGDVTSSAGSCATTVSAIQGTSVGAPTGTAGSAIVLKTSPTLTTPTLTTPTANQGTFNQPIIMGDTTAGSPAAGQVGEVISTSATGVGMTNSSITPTVSNIESMSVTAGHWMCSAVLQVTPSGGIAQSTAIGMSTTSATFGPSVGSAALAGTGAASGSAVNANATPYPFNFTSTTTLYGVVQTFFSAGSETGTSYLQCQRIW